MTDYQAPVVTVLGSLGDFTRQGSNKIGLDSDVFSPALIGSIVPAVP